MPISLRLTTADDLALVEAWDEKPHLQDTGGDDDWDWPNQLGRRVSWREMLIAELDGRAIGFLQIIDCRLEESHYWGDDCPQNSRAIDIWIGEETDIGKGYGTQMMRLALQRCFADTRVTHTLIDPLASNTKAHRFYEAVGFTLVGPRRFDTDDCLIYQITRADWRKGNQND